MERLRRILTEAAAELDKIDRQVKASPGLAVPGIYDAMRGVLAFHEKNNVAKRTKLTRLTSQYTVMQELERTAAEMSTRAEHLTQVLKVGDDERGGRAHLIIEETAELLSAMHDMDEVKTLDALADLLYVVIGTAVMLDLPLDEAFGEVHASNMSKERQKDDPLGDRVRDKGPNYKPPALDVVLNKYRESQRRPHMMVNGADCTNCNMSVQEVDRQIYRYGKVTCKGYSVD
jgi:phosphoribosyl-ATP pyrophosphohydrolase